MRAQSLYQGPWNFLGREDRRSAPDQARAWVLPVPYEGTTSYGAGTREGPAAIIAASRQVEKYDHEFHCVPAEEFGIHTLNPLAPVHRSPEAMMEAIERAVREILTGAPHPEVLCVLGGEHSISGGVARGIAAAGVRKLVAVHIDAHGDLRDTYEGSANSHACAARRVAEICPLFQIGIRNISAEEEEYCRTSGRVTTVFAENRDPRKYLKALARFVRGKQVYFTIDVDGLDPSIMPATGTPEPGGLLWEETLAIVRTVCASAAAVPVFDVVELAPIPGLRGPDFLAAKLIYKTMSYLLLDGRRA
ncbi:MAG: agmatinase [Planctomycetota bacterium]